MLRQEDVQDAARATGFDLAGAAPATTIEHQCGLDDWLRQAFQGSMAWMERLTGLRHDPRRLLRGARSVISLGVNYYSLAPHSEATGTGKISRYAWGANYHKLIRRQLVQFATELNRRAPGTTVRLAVDTAPILEKPWAHQAGVGWVGKHANVLTKEFGSWIFLAECVVDAAVEPAPTATDHCGTCTRCIDACPTQAIVAPTLVDSRRCISYLTIEHQGAIAPTLRAGIGAWVFGCDICQDVCPWNKFQKPSREVRYQPRPGNQAPDLAGLAKLTEDQFHRRFAGTNIRRAKWPGFLRNVFIALGNAGAPEASHGALRHGLSHASSLVRQHAAWAAGRLGARRLLHAQRRVEDNAEVLAELEQALDD